MPALRRLRVRHRKLAGVGRPPGAKFGPSGPRSHGLPKTLTNTTPPPRRGIRCQDAPVAGPAFPLKPSAPPRQRAPTYRPDPDAPAQPGQCPSDPEPLSQRRS
eukprot:15295413-Alexandrium_andersonii.AAC.1